MFVIVYENPDAYLRDYEAVLLEKEAISQLILYEAYRLRQKTYEDKEGLFGVVMDENSPILHFFNMPSRNLIIYIQDDSRDIRQAAMILADYLAENQIIPEGLNAKYEVCEAFIGQFTKSFNCTFAERMALYIMEIRQLIDIKPAEGRTRLAIPNEVKLLTEWMIQYQIEALAKEVDYESALTSISKLINNNKLYVFENAQQIVVSMAAATRRLARGVAINNVYTPEEYRGMGYAATNIYNISKTYLEDGNVFCTLFVDKNNILSKRAYEKVGYNVIDDIYEYKLLQG